MVEVPELVGSVADDSILSCATTVQSGGVLSTFTEVETSSARTWGTLDIVIIRRCGPCDGAARTDRAVVGNGTKHRRVIYDKWRGKVARSNFVCGITTR